MKILDLPVESRDKLGSANSRRYCRAGMIPSILYGGKRESIPLVFSAESFDQVMRAHTALVRLDLAGTRQTALVRDITWDTFGEYIQHVDLQRVEMEDEIQIAVPVHIIGVPAGVAHGGVLNLTHKELPVHARVDSIPSEIHIDVSALDVGDRLLTKEVEYPAHVRPALPEEEPVCVVNKPKVHIDHHAESEEGEGEAGEGEAPAEGGEAPASDASE